MKTVARCDDTITSVAMRKLLRVLSFLLACLTSVSGLGTKDSNNEPLKTSVGCDAVRLRCDEGMMLVVTGATFIPERQTPLDCSKPVLSLSSNHDLLQAVIAKCNGVREGLCDFIMNQDIPGSEVGEVGG